jgi:hypothetical protein
MEKIKSFFARKNVTLSPKKYFFASKFEQAHKIFVDFLG